MIQLTINEQAIELDNKSKVQLTAHNPAFDDVLVSRAYSFPFTVPASGTNMHALGHINRLDARLTKTTLPARVRLGGGAEWVGVVEIGSITPERVELVFKNKPRVSADLLNNTMLNTIMPTIQIAQVVLPYWRVFLLPAIGGQLHQITINGEVYEVTSTGPADIVTASNTIAAAINADYAGLATVDVPTESILIAPTAAQTVQFDIGWSENTVYSTDFLHLGKARLQSFQSFLNNLFVSHSDQVTFPLVYAPKLFYDKDVSKKANPIFAINYNRSLDYTMPIPEITSDVNQIDYKYAFVPQVRLSHIFDRIIDVLGLGSWRLADYANSDIAKCFVWNNRLLEAYTEQWGVREVPGLPGAYETVFGGRGYYLHYATQIDLNDHVANKSIGTFISEIAQLFNCNFDIESDALVFRPNIKQLQNAQHDVTEFVSNQYELEAKRAAEIQLAFEVDEKDAFPVPVDQLVPIGSGEKYLVIAPLPDTVYINKLHGSVDTCGTYYQGISDMYGLKLEIKNTRLAWERDTVWSVGGQVLSSTHLAAVGLPFSFELVDTTVTGLYKLFWQAWMPILRARDATFYLFMPLHRISTLQDWINARMLLRLSMGQVTILPTSIEVEEGAGLQGLMKIEAKIY